MAATESLEGVHSQLRDDTLPGIGIENDTVRELLAYRLLIERLGERQNNYWWDSQVFSEFGRETLIEDVPRTATRTRIELAQRVGRVAERDKLEDDWLSLFDLGPQVESLVERELDSVEETASFEILETLEMTFKTPDWGVQLIPNTELALPSSGDSFEVASIAKDNIDDVDAVYSLVPNLVRGYGASIDNQLRVPYIRID